jgi:hypothetical protein
MFEALKPLEINDLWTSMDLHGSPFDIFWSGKSAPRDSRETRIGATFAIFNTLAMRANVPGSESASILKT